jgi:hypothetical protein
MFGGTHDKKDEGGNQMVERLTITAMGRQRLRDILRDRVRTALVNLSLHSNDEARSDAAVSAIIAAGEYQEFPDHGSRQDPSSCQ